MNDGGKGSAMRPKQVSEDQFSKNWDTIFNKNKKEDNSDSKGESKTSETVDTGEHYEP